MKKTLIGGIKLTAMLLLTAVVATGCKNKPLKGVENGHEWVDLGLPSGTLWATCNVGANSPEECGDYFAWGETKTKDVYDMETYKYDVNGYSESGKLTKLCSNANSSDNNYHLLPEYDAATANWGDGWRMPTRAEFGELEDNCAVTWTTQIDSNGRIFNCRIFTAPNGNSILLPATGHIGGNSFFYTDCCYYWFNDFSGDESGGYPLNNEFGNDCYWVDIDDSFVYGMPVRPVRSASPK